MRRILTATAIAAFVASAAIPALAREANDPNAGHPVAAKLVGGWAPTADQCPSGAGWLFRPDGRFGTEGFDGQWRVTGRTLFIAGFDFEMGENPTPYTDVSAERYAVERAESDRLVLARKRDGRVLRFVRCP